jgi:hypothetical protein
MTGQEVFDADLARMNAALEKLEAIITCNDGWRGIDPLKVPAHLLSAYQNLLSYGYANGLLR